MVKCCNVIACGYSNVGKSSYLEKLVNNAELDPPKESLQVHNKKNSSSQSASDSASDKHSEENSGSGGIPHFKSSTKEDIYLCTVKSNKGPVTVRIHDTRGSDWENKKSVHYCHFGDGFMIFYDIQKFCKKCEYLTEFGGLIFEYHFHDEFTILPRS